MMMTIRPSHTYLPAHQIQYLLAIGKAIFACGLDSRRGPIRKHGSPPLSDIGPARDPSGSPSEAQTTQKRVEPNGDPPGLIRDLGMLARFASICVLNGRRKLGKAKMPTEPRDNKSFGMCAFWPCWAKHGLCWAKVDKRDWQGSTKLGSVCPNVVRFGPGATKLMPNLVQVLGRASPGRPSAPAPLWRVRR